MADEFIVTLFYKLFYVILNITCVIVLSYSY